MKILTLFIASLLGTACFAQDFSDEDFLCSPEGAAECLRNEEDLRIESLELCQFFINALRDEGYLLDAVDYRGSARNIWTRCEFNSRYGYYEILKFTWDASLNRTKKLELGEGIEEIRFVDSVSDLWTVSVMHGRDDFDCLSLTRQGEEHAVVSREEGLRGILPHIAPCF